MSRRRSSRAQVNSWNQGDLSKRLDRMGYGPEQEPPADYVPKPPPVVVNEPDPYEIPDWWSDDYAEETLRIAEKVTRRTLAARRIPTNRTMALDLADAVIFEGLTFRSRFQHSDSDNMPQAWYATLTVWLSNYARQWLIGIGDERRTLHKAYSTSSVEANNEMLGDSWLGPGEGRDSIMIRSLDLMPPERFVLLEEAILDGVDPREGDYKPDTLCSMAGCDKPRQAQGLCNNHYQQDRYHWTGTRRAEPFIPKVERQCTEPGCEELVGPSGYRDLCRGHYRAAKDAEAPQCQEPGCESPAVTRGRCTRHYQQWLNTQGGPCSVKGCGRTERTRGLCSMHYQRWRTYGSTDLPEKVKATCTAPDCDLVVLAKGLCSKHYARQKYAKKKAAS